jgi:hypothetical protein
MEGSSRTFRRRTVTSSSQVVKGWQPGLSWFNSGAVEHIQRMHELKVSLKACGVHIGMLTSRSPGVIVWRDRRQILAKP